MKKILFIGSHTDDVELACGGTISRLISEGKEVFYLALSTCHEPVRLEHECRVSCETLGIKPENVIIQHFEVRNFPNLRQIILQYLIDLNAKHNFDTVFTHSAKDTHQDHSTVAEETLRAFRKSTILAYELPWNINMSRCNAFFELTDMQLTAKINALYCYHSQADREYMKENFIKSWGVINGIKCNADYAEPFEVIRFII